MRRIQFSRKATRFAEVLVLGCVLILVAIAPNSPSSAADQAEVMLGLATYHKKAPHPGDCLPADSGAGLFVGGARRLPTSPDRSLSSWVQVADYGAR